jgi:hypothetical protein
LDGFLTASDPSSTVHVQSHGAWSHSTTRTNFECAFGVALRPNTTWKCAPAMPSRVRRDVNIRANFETSTSVQTSRRQHPCKLRDVNIRANFPVRVPSRSYSCFRVSFTLYSLRVVKTYPFDLAGSPDCTAATRSRAVTNLVGSLSRLVCWQFANSSKSCPSRAVSGRGGQNRQRLCVSHDWVVRLGQPLRRRTPRMACRTFAATILLSRHPHVICSGPFSNTKKHEHICNGHV